MNIETRLLAYPIVVEADGVVALVEVVHAAEGNAVLHLDGALDVDVIAYVPLPICLLVFVDLAVVALSLAFAPHRLLVEALAVQLLLGIQFALFFSTKMVSQGRRTASWLSEC